MLLLLLLLTSAEALVYSNNKCPDIKKIEEYYIDYRIEHISGRSDLCIYLQSFQVSNNLKTRENLQESMPPAGFEPATFRSIVFRSDHRAIETWREFWVEHKHAC